MSEQKREGRGRAEYDPYGDLIAANRDAILQMHKEAVRRVRRCLEAAKGLMPFDGRAYQSVSLGLAVLDALGLFHPMHAESWAGWPGGSEVRAADTRPPPAPAAPPGPGGAPSP